MSGGRASARTRLAAALALLLGAGLVFSFFRTGYFGTQRLAVSVRMGSVYYWRGRATGYDGFAVQPRWTYRDWWWDFLWLNVAPRHGWIPLWIPLLLVILAGTWSWVRDCRRARPGHCTVCGYDLTGNTAGRCPECGAATASAAGAK